MLAKPETKARAKTAMDIELLLRWAYVDELSKRQSSAAEGIWDHILDYQNHGGIDSGRGAAQRYAHFGLPDADAERIEKAVSTLPDTVIDWEAHFDLIAGDLAGLVSINQLDRQIVGRPPAPKAGWGKSGDKALKAFFGNKGAAPLPARDRPRDVLMLGGIKTRVLVTAHAIKGTRPDWVDDDPEPKMTPSTHGKGVMVDGECKGKNLYSTGSVCPLTWLPSPLSVIMSRMDYFAWHQGLTVLAETMALEKFDILLPNAPAAPWLGNEQQSSRVVPVMPNGRNSIKPWGTLPLAPQRPRAGPTRRQRHDPGRSVFGDYDQRADD